MWSTFNDSLDEQLRVEPRDSVDVVTADGGEVGHADVTLAAFIDERHAGQSRVVAGESRAHLVEKARVDFINDFQMAREEPAEQAHGPLLQRLRQQGVIGVGKGVPRDVPGSGPVHQVLVHQQPHELRHGDRRMSVVELH